MRNALSIAALFTVLAGLPSDAAAQSLSFEIKNGLVTIDAQDVTVWEILQRWSAAGVTFVDADKIPRTPVTLALTGVPEINALEILLRGVSGYIVARREPSEGAPSSSFDRVLIVANSTPPQVATRVAPQDRRAGVAFVQQGPEVDDEDLSSPAPGFAPFNGAVNGVGVPPAGGPASARPAISIGSAGVAFAPGAAGAVSPVSPPANPARGMIDALGNPVVGPTQIPDPVPPTGESSERTPAGQPGSTGASRPGTISPVRQSPQ